MNCWPQRIPLVVIVIMLPFYPNYLRFLLSISVYTRDKWLKGWWKILATFRESWRTSLVWLKCALIAPSFFFSLRPPAQLYTIWSLCCKQTLCLCLSLHLLSSRTVLWKRLRRTRAEQKRTLTHSQDEYGWQRVPPSNTPHDVGKSESGSRRASLRDVYPYCTYAHVCIWD